MHSSTLKSAKGVNKWKERDVVLMRTKERDEKGYNVCVGKRCGCVVRRITRNVRRQQHAFKYLTTNIVIILISFLGSTSRASHFTFFIDIKKRILKY
jgi:hypothetical protein